MTYKKKQHPYENNITLAEFKSIYKSLLTINDSEFKKIDLEKQNIFKSDLIFSPILTDSTDPKELFLGDFIDCKFNSIEEIRSKNEGSKYFVNYFFKDPLESPKEKLAHILSMETFETPKKFTLSIYDAKDKGKIENISFYEISNFNLPYTKNDAWKGKFSYLKEYYTDIGLKKIHSIYNKLDVNSNDQIAFIFNYLLDSTSYLDTIKKDPNLRNYKNYLNNKIDKTKEQIKSLKKKLTELNNEYLLGLKNLDLEEKEALALITGNEDKDEEKALNRNIKKDITDYILFTRFKSISVEELTEENKAFFDSLINADFNSLKGIYRRYLDIKLDMVSYEGFKSQVKLFQDFLIKAEDPNTTEYKAVITINEINENIKEELEINLYKNVLSKFRYTNNVINKIIYNHLDFTKAKEKDKTELLNYYDQLKEEKGASIESKATQDEVKAEMLNNKNCLINENEDPFIIFNNTKENFKYNISEENLIIMYEDYTLRIPLRLSIPTLRNWKDYDLVFHLYDILNTGNADKLQRLYQLIFIYSSRLKDQTSTTFRIPLTEIEKEIFKNETLIDSNNKIDKDKLTTLRQLLEIIYRTTISNPSLHLRHGEKKSLKNSFSLIASRPLVNDKEIEIEITSIFKALQLYKNITSTITYADNNYNNYYSSFVYDYLLNMLNSPNFKEGNIQGRDLNLYNSITSTTSLEKKEIDAINSKHPERFLNPLKDIYNDLKKNTKDIAFSENKNIKNINKIEEIKSVMIHIEKIREYESQTLLNREAQRKQNIQDKKEGKRLTKTKKRKKDPTE